MVVVVVRVNAAFLSKSFVIFHYHLASQALLVFLAAEEGLFSPGMMCHCLSHEEASPGIFVSAPKISPVPHNWITHYFSFLCNFRLWGWQRHCQKPHLCLTIWSHHYFLRRSKVVAVSWLLLLLSLLILHTRLALENEGLQEHGGATLTLISALVRHFSPVRKTFFINHLCLSAFLIFALLIV